MKITIEVDDDTVEVFQNVTDCYIAVRQYEAVAQVNGASEHVEHHPKTFGKIYGPTTRETLKEMRQGVVEVEEMLAIARAVERQRRQAGIVSGHA